MNQTELENEIARLKRALVKPKRLSTSPQMIQRRIDNLEDWLWDLRHPVRAWFRPKNIRHKIATVLLQLARWFEPGIGYDSE